MSPVYNEEFVPPRVNTPWSETEGEEGRLIQHPISGLSNCPELVSSCQKGIDCVEEAEEKARPIIPATSPRRTPEEVLEAVTSTRIGIRSKETRGENTRKVWF